MRFPFVLGLLAMAISCFAQTRCLIPDVNPGKAEVRLTPRYVQLSNNCLDARWLRLPDRIGEGFFTNKLATEAHGISLGEQLFKVGTGGQSQTGSVTMKLVSGPSTGTDPAGGKEVSAVFEGSNIEVDWRAILRDGSNYIREVATFKAIEQDFDATTIQLVDSQCVGPQVMGTVLGSPISNGFFFMGMEYPTAHSSVQGPQASSWVERKIPIAAATPVTYSAVFGVSPRGQMRRAFLNYVERERAHPYRPFLHYNSWLDISYGVPYTADQCVEALNAFGQELVQKRGVHMESSLFDDGWDDTHTVWDFNSGFPNGFTPLKETTEKYGFAPGVWLSPWGGYGDARTQRLETGKKEGYEIDRQGYALSGPKYFERFRQVCLDFVRKYGVNQFKFDGTGSPDKHTPGSRFDSDFDAAIQLIHDLRSAEPDIFINLTTGTWPSPFWLRYADSTWRGGDDSSFAGVGTKRQQWITYRDGDTYHGVVQKGWLYPLNSLMLHGIIYATHADGLDTDPGNDFADEVHSYFGTGTQLQEMYITHSLLTSQNWDDLAESAKWSAANADELVDTHWVGGDPTKLEVYGWAAWCPRKASLVLRNPSDKPQSFTFDPGRVLELHSGLVYRAHSPWKADASQADLKLETGQQTTIQLQPFEVKTLDLWPSGSPRP